MTVPFRLPAIGLGCSPYRGDQVVALRQSIEWALDLGYQLLDTAEAYGTERLIGELLGRIGTAKRERVVVVSKLWHTNHHPNHVGAACEETLERLGLDELDLYLVHSPQAWCHTGPLGDLSGASIEEARSRLVPRNEAGDVALADVSLVETWAAMERLVERGLVRSIGVSNADREALGEILAMATIGPAVNQVAIQPGRSRPALVDFCQQHDIGVMAHSPLSAPGRTWDPSLRQLAKQLGRSVAQVVLRWSVERGTVPLPSSISRSHLVENLAVMDFSLDATEIETVSRLSREISGTSV